MTDVNILHRQRDALRIVKLMITMKHNWKYLFNTLYQVSSCRLGFHAKLKQCEGLWLVSLYSACPFMDIVHCFPASLVSTIVISFSVSPQAIYCIVNQHFHDLESLQIQILVAVKSIPSSPWSRILICFPCHLVIASIHNS